MQEIVSGIWSADLRVKKITEKNHRRIKNFFPPKTKRMFCPCKMKGSIDSERRRDGAITNLYSPTFKRAVHLQRKGN